jgi:hypothetical protein
LATYLLPPYYKLKGLLTVYLREKNIGDAVEGAVIRKQNKIAKKNEKARLHAKK